MSKPTDIQTVLKEADLLFDKAAVEQALDNMALEVTNALADTNPIILPVMNGGLIPAGLLLPKLNFSLEVDYLHATRYRGETSGQELAWFRKPSKSIKDRVLLLIDDILDEGITLAAIVKECKEMGAEKVYTAVLADKELGYERDFAKADFTGLVVPNRYVFGFGMDYHHYHRNQAGIYAVKDL